jgi:2-amino-4-hydroxy-6-hydroxymethyldihydropteridine diphosphokinase
MEQEKHQACLLLGSNIQPEQNIPRAVAHLQRQLTVLQASSIWQSDAMGSSGPDFLNGALLVSTPLDADALKEQVIHPLEVQLGRVRTEEKNAPRIIDIDIILFDEILFDPTLWKYAYRAVPVAELLPGYRSDSGEYLKDAALRLARTTPISARKDISIYPDPFTSKDCGAKPAGAQDD